MKHRTALIGMSAVVALAAAFVIPAMPARAAVEPTVSLDSSEYPETAIRFRADPRVSVANPLPVALNGTLVVHLPQDTDLSDVAVNSHSGSTEVVDDVAKTVTISNIDATIPYGLPLHDVFYVMGLRHPQVVPNPLHDLEYVYVLVTADAPALQDYFMQLEKRGGIAADRCDVSTGAGCIALEPDVPMTFTLPRSPDWDSFGGLSLAGAEVTFGSLTDPAYLAGQLQHSISLNGQSIQVTLPRSTVAPLSATMRTNLLYKMTINWKTWTNPGVTSATTTVTLKIRDPNSLVVKAIYQDLFGRAPDPAGFDGWVRALDSGTNPGVVANGITSSAEFRSGLIVPTYVNVLGRYPAQGEINAWLAAFHSGITLQQMEAGFLGSPELASYVPNNAEWVTALYEYILYREPSPAEVTAWTAVLDRGASRYAVAMGFEISTEYLRSLVTDAYLALLDRDPDPEGRDRWVTALQGSSRYEQIVAGIVGSDEYRALALRDDVGPAAAAHSAELGRQGTPRRFGASG